MSSQLRVNSIEPSTTGIAVSFPFGLSVSPGYALTTSGLNVSGVITATSFYGDGSALTNLPLAPIGQIIALYTVI